MYDCISFALAFLILLSVIIFAVLFIDTIVSDSQYDLQAPSESLPDSSFTRISQGSRMSIFRETNTDILYAVYHIGNKGGMTIMLNSDGKPLLYQDWLNLNRDRDIESIYSQYESFAESQ